MKPSQVVQALRVVLSAPKTIASLKGQVQHLTDILHNSNSSCSGPFTDYEQKVSVLSQMYEGVSEFGGELTQSLVQTRAMFQVGGGIKIKMLKANPLTKKWIEQWLEYNLLSSGFLLQLAIEAEIEGKCLLRLVNDPKNQMINVKWISYTSNKYTVTADPSDYSVYTGVSWESSASATTLKESEFVYCKFGGRLNRVNNCPPKLGNIIEQIQSVSQVLKDVRKTNHLFPSPTPHVDAEDSTGAEEVESYMSRTNWRPGQALITAKCKISYVSPPENGVTALPNEAILNIKIISGVAGVPVHYMGLADLMTNRATADNTMEGVEASNGPSRGIWVAKINELMVKSIEMHNLLYNKGLDPDCAKLELPSASRTILQDIATVFMPLRNSGSLSLETMLGLIPGIDVEKEMALIKDEQNEMLTMVNTNGANMPGVNTRDIGGSPLQQAKKAGTQTQDRNNSV